MRLLSTRTRELREFFDDERPPYAILSHRWLSQEEVSFRELSELYCASENGPETGPIASRSGYLKIQGCRQQALQDGFDWVWIDTCCIDKSSSAELSEAINSMFNWYKDSDICYAYLTDVPDATDDITQPESAFRMSQWFLRGWTLQELLAPRKVRFLDASWNSIGDLQEGTVLLHVVSEVSRISPEYLTGQPMETASIARRMSWASRRRTTRKEDIAYCLLGIFDVNMPLLYGEGDKAFVRLQEEIMKHTTDHTILAWGVNSGKRNFGKTLKETSPEECHEYGVLARSPADFADSSNFMPCGSLVRSKTSTFTLTEKGLWIHCFHEKLPNPCHYTAVFLNCYDTTEPTSRLALKIPWNLFGIRDSGKLSELLVRSMEVGDGTPFNPARDARCISRIGRQLLSTDQLDCSTPWPLDNRIRSLHYLAWPNTVRSFYYRRLLFSIKSPSQSAAYQNGRHPGTVLIAIQAPSLLRLSGPFLHSGHSGLPNERSTEDGYGQPTITTTLTLQILPGETKYMHFFVQQVTTKGSKGLLLAMKITRSKNGKIQGQIRLRRHRRSVDGDFSDQDPDAAFNGRKAMVGWRGKFISAGFDTYGCNDQQLVGSIRMQSVLKFLGRRARSKLAASIAFLFGPMWWAGGHWFSIWLLQLVPISSFGLDFYGIWAFLLVAIQFPYVISFVVKLWRDVRELQDEI